MREYNPDLDRALRLEHGRHELRRVLRWPTVDVDHDPMDSTCGPVRCACGASSATGRARGVIRITRVVRQRTIVTEAIPERSLRAEAREERYTSLFWLSAGVMIAVLVLGQLGTGPGIMVMTLGLAGALVGCVEALAHGHD